MNTTFGVKDICERFAVGEHTVLGWIRNGELKAINVGRAPGKLKPRYRITQKALDEFEASRTTSPPPSIPRRKKRSTARYY